ncbi:MAG: methyltransferase domain-containing protein [Thermaerobacter sp.]|nr:methyltransferase domain-containing protein [Thermaerobacter sp.]
MAFDVSGQGAEDVKARLASALQRWLSDAATVAMIRRSLEAGVVLDTWMAGRREEDLAASALGIVEREVGSLTEQAKGRVFPSHHLSPGYLATAFHELLSSMAMFLAHRERGTLEAGEEEAAKAVERLRAFAAAEPNGLNAPVGLYWLITTYENYGALLHYGRITEEDFRFGVFHRPWIRNTLDEELALAEILGHVERRHPCPEGRCVLLTPEGRKVHRRIRRLLEESGELSWRMQQQHLALFNELEDYDELVNRMFTTEPANTLDFIQFAGASAGSRILEVGCGSGRVTLNLGLYEKALPGGCVAATDPSVNMLAHAQAKAVRMEAGNVDFVRAPAEELPFADNEFDLAMGVLCIHLSDVRRAIKEMARVTRPGGTVAVYTALRTEANTMPVLPIWFDPILRLARARGGSAATAGSLPNEVADAMRKAGLGQVVTIPREGLLVAVDSASFVRLTLQGAGAFQDALEALPYAERLRLVEELEEQGREICATTTLEERTWRWKGEFVRGRVPAG